MNRLVKTYESFEPEEEWGEEIPDEREIIQNIFDHINEPNLIELYHGDRVDGWTWLDTIETDFDGEKGYIDFDLIIKRSDDKIFKVEGSYWGRGEFDFERRSTQVFPRKKTIIVYE
ncbi:MAG: hypothetical protein KDH96_13640 [Candidatus Riesia sp.]|nr:hypothetical protein [Candidatus Riesia sp.]